MEEDILELVERLSLQDKKNISQSLLKTVEEIGELAQLVLPYENVPTTEYKKFSQEELVNESVDVVLAAMSTAIKLAGSKEVVVEAMRKKAAVWERILRTGSK